jgi:hypothetical protein
MYQCEWTEVPGTSEDGMDRQTDKVPDGRTGGQIDRWTDRWIDRWTDIQI